MINNKYGYGYKAIKNKSYEKDRGKGKSKGKSKGKRKMPTKAQEKIRKREKNRKKIIEMRDKGYKFAGSPKMIISKSQKTANNRLSRMPKKIKDKMYIVPLENVTGSGKIYGFAVKGK